MTVLTVQRAWRIMDACGRGSDCRRGFKGWRGLDEQSGLRLTRL